MLPVFSNKYCNVRRSHCGGEARIGYRRAREGSRGRRSSESVKVKRMRSRTAQLRILSIKRPYVILFTDLLGRGCAHLLVSVSLNLLMVRLPTAVYIDLLSINFYY